MTLDADVGVHRQPAGRRRARCIGGLVQGIGLALSEDFDDLEKHTTMVACGLPYIKDAPDALELDFLETPRPSGPFGAGGLRRAAAVRRRTPRSSTPSTMPAARGSRTCRRGRRRCSRRCRRPWPEA